MNRFLEYWNLFIITAESKSFTKASKKLFISHTALIKRINSLEEMLRIKLFIRSNNGIELTPAGQFMYLFIKKESVRVGEFIEEARQMDKRYSKETLRIGTLADCYCVEFRDISALFKKRFPYIELVFSSVTSNFYKNLRTGKLDLINAPFKSYVNDGLSFLNLSEKGVICIFSTSHPLSYKKQLSVSDLNNFSLALFPKKFNSEQQLLWDFISDNCPNASIKELNSNNSLQPSLLFDQRILVCYHSNTRLREFIEIPLECPLSVNFGLIYKPNPRALVQKYLDVATELYSQKK